MLPRAAGAGGSSTHNLHAFLCTRPGPFRQLHGPTMDWPYILVILGIAVILYLIGSLRVLRQYERGVVFLLGKFEGVRGPGLTIIFVPIQQMVRVSLRTVTMQSPSKKSSRRITSRSTSRRSLTTVRCCWERGRRQGHKRSPCLGRARGLG
jgi:hypothetical protein